MNKLYWENISQEYDKEIFNVFKNDKNKIIQKNILKVSSKHKQVVDAGCGVGKWLNFLSAHFEKVYATDFSSNCLNQAKENNRKNSNIEFIQHNLASPLKRIQNVDVVISISSIISGNTITREKILRSIREMLKKNGYLILVVPSHESSIYREYIKTKMGVRKTNNINNGSELKKEFINYKKGVVNIEGVATKHFIKEELTNTLESAGYKIEKIEKVEYPWSTEFNTIPRWLKDPYPWDWLVIAKKSVV